MFSLVRLQTITILIQVRRNYSAPESVIFFSPMQIVFVPSVPLLQAEFLLITSVFVPQLLQAGTTNTDTLVVRSIVSTVRILEAYIGLTVTARST